MSIYASIPGIDRHEPCGGARRYRGSHILPTADDPRSAEIGLALIPPHITRDGRDDQPEDGRPWPWLRVHLVCGDADAVLITPEQARHLAQQLTAWADSAAPSAFREGL